MKETMLLFLACCVSEVIQWWIKNPMSDNTPDDIGVIGGMYEDSSCTLLYSSCFFLPCLKRWLTQCDLPTIALHIFQLTSRYIPWNYNMCLYSSYPSCKCHCCCMIATSLANMCSVSWSTKMVHSVGRCANK